MIFLRQSYNVKPLRWGSAQDIEYAVKVNAEKVYDVDPDSIVLCMPLFWGLPCLDYSGKRNDGVNHGAYYFDGELEFDGNSSYINCGHDESLNITGEITLETRIYYIEQRDTHPTIISKHKDSCLNSNWSDIVYALGIVRGTPDVVRAGFDGASFSSTTALEHNNWYHLVLIYKGSTTSLYINGVFDKSASQNFTWVSGTQDLVIGIRKCNTSAIFEYTGMINEARISNVARTANQIALFHALPYGLYQPVLRCHYSLPMPPYVFTKNLSDTINISDVISSKNIGLNKADTISLSDSIIKKPGLNKADIISLSDSIAKSFSFSKADTINMTDSIIKTFGLNKNDTITLSDLMIKGFGLNKADTITLSDSIAKAFGLSLSDTINLSDSILSKNIGALLDFIAKNKTFNFIAKPGG